MHKNSLGRSAPSRRETRGSRKIQHVQRFHSVQAVQSLTSVQIIEEPGLVTLSERATYALNRSRR